MSVNSGEITMQLSHPLTEEQWDTITDVDLEHTNSICFHTKHGKDVEFVKVVRCKYCKFWETVIDRTKAEYGICAISKFRTTPKEYFCPCGAQREVTE